MIVKQDNTTWTLRWPHGEAELQSLGGMLAPVTFTLADDRRFQPMQIAPWASEASPHKKSAKEEDTQATVLPGILQRLRGEWPCVPFGRDDRPADLPAAWTKTELVSNDDQLWGHGFGSHHHWHLIDQSNGCLRIAIDYPTTSSIMRLEREIRADPDEPALDITLTVIARQAITVPIALHPTFRLPSEHRGVTLEQIDFDQAVTYPVPAEAGVSHLTPGAHATDLAQMPGGGDHIDLMQLPLDISTEELLQLKNCRPPIVLHYRAENARVSLTWDQQLLPDIMLWVSNGGRSAEPWRSRHYALGIEPVNGPFDLGQVATPPADHPLAERRGIALTPDHPCVIRARLAAW